MMSDPEDLGLFTFRNDPWQRRALPPTRVALRWLRGSMLALLLAAAWATLPCQRTRQGEQTQLPERPAAPWRPLEGVEAPCPRALSQLQPASGSALRAVRLRVADGGRLPGGRER